MRTHLLYEHRHPLCRSSPPISSPGMHCAWTGDLLTCIWFGGRIPRQCLPAFFFCILSLLVFFLTLSAVLSPRPPPLFHRGRSDGRSHGLRTRPEPRGKGLRPATSSHSSVASTCSPAWKGRVSHARIRIGPFTQYTPGRPCALPCFYSPPMTRLANARADSGGAMG